MPEAPKGLDGTVKKELHIFYVLDTSGSMDGNPIGTLNDAMRATVEELKKLVGEKADLFIAAMEYNSKARWITQGSNGLEKLQDFIWQDLKAAGMTSLGEALTELDASLSRKDKMKAQTGNKIPVIIFMSDGYPNDEWERPLENLVKNRWYQVAIKIAFALGKDADADVLAKVVGTIKVDKDPEKKTETITLTPNPEAVIRTNDLKQFADMIKVVSVSSTLAASTSRTVDQALTGEVIVKGVTNGAPVVNGAVTPPATPDPPIYAPPSGEPPFGNIDDDDVM